jgi:hypothetical protein
MDRIDRSRIYNHLLNVHIKSPTIEGFSPQFNNCVPISDFIGLGSKEVHSISNSLYAKAVQSFRINQLSDDVSFFNYLSFEIIAIAIEPVRGVNRNVRLFLSQSEKDLQEYNFNFNSVFLNNSKAKNLVLNLCADPSTLRDIEYDMSHARDWRKAVNNSILKSHKHLDKIPNSLSYYYELVLGYKALNSNSWVNFLIEYGKELKSFVRK